MEQKMPIFFFSRRSLRTALGFLALEPGSGRAGSKEEGRMWGLVSSVDARFDASGG